MAREFPWVQRSADKFLPRRVFGWLALGVAVFTAYGSFVPFDFHARDLRESVGAFRWAVENRAGIQSRSDVTANFVLGLPLGLFLFAWRLLDREPRVRTFVGHFVFWWPWCVALAVAVEYGQLFFPGRTTSGSDILAQAAGSAVGMLLYAAVGQRAVDHLRNLFDRDGYRSPAVGLLVLYVAALALAQLLPLDISASPASWVRKFKDGQVTIGPFSELDANPAVPAWRKGQAWLELAAVYLPVGLILGFVPFAIPVRPEGGPAWPAAVRAGRRVLGFGLLLAFALEAGQLLVMSRSPSTTDVLLGGGAVLLGWLLAGGMGVRAAGGGIDVEAALILGQAWLLWLAVAAWLPFEFDNTIADGRLTRMNWVPFAHTQEKVSYMGALEEAVMRMLAFLPFGVVVAACGPATAANRRSRIVAGGLLAAALAAVVEAGQLFIPERVAAPTDVLYAAVGGAVGAAGTSYLRRRLAADVPSVGLETTPPPANPLDLDDPLKLGLG
jgi:VanZ family protein